MDGRNTRIRFARVQGKGETIALIGYKKLHVEKTNLGSVLPSCSRGHMKRSGSKYIRTLEKASLIADYLYKECLQPDGQKRFLRTGDVILPGNLHTTEVLSCLKWVCNSQFAGNFFTRAACEEAISVLVTKFQLRVPLQPTQTVFAWTSEQGKRLQHLACRARRNYVARLWYNWEGPMDDADTQPVALWQTLDFAPVDLNP